jgi:hypothetical protein
MGPENETLEAVNQEPTNQEETPQEEERTEQSEQYQDRVDRGIIGVMDSEDEATEVP